VPLFEDLGNHHVAISTRVPAAQQYFDQGMRLVYGFNHPEAIRAFDEAARLDADCAICHWGAALAYGPHVNAPMDSASGVAAHQHLREAIALRSRASARERAFIDALAKRYTSPPRPTAPSSTPPMRTPWRTSSVGIHETSTRPRSTPRR
jgi:hypothetical protein